MASIGHGRPLVGLSLPQSPGLARHSEFAAPFDDDLLVACGKGALRLKRLQRSGKAAIAAEDFQRGNPLRPGDRLQ